MGIKAYSFINGKQAAELKKLREIEDEWRIKEKEIGFRQDDIVLRHIFDTQDEAEKDRLFDRFVKMKKMKIQQTEEQVKAKEAKLIEQEAKAQKLFAQDEANAKKGKAAQASTITSFLTSSSTNSMITRKPNPMMTDPVLLRKKVIYQLSFYNNTRTNFFTIFQAMELGITLERLKQLNSIPSENLKKMQKIIRRWLLQRSWAKTVASYEKVEDRQIKSRERRLEALKEASACHAAYTELLETQIEVQ